MKLADLLSTARTVRILDIGRDQELASDIQARLSALGLLDPPADGLFGPVSRWALSCFLAVTDREDRTVLDSHLVRDLLNSDPEELFPVLPGDDLVGRVVRAMSRRGDWIARHPKCVNIVYVEGMDPDGTPNDNAGNVFNDLRIAFRISDTGVPEALGVWGGTAEPSRYWTENPMNAKGAARIAFAQFKAWALGVHHPNLPSAHEALVQVRPIKVYRDLDKDFKRSNDRTEVGLFYVNQHWGYDNPRGDMGNSGAGCLVGRTKTGHREFMKIVKTDVRFVPVKSYIFVTSVLPAELV